MNQPNTEAVGEAYSLEKMQHAQAQTWQAVTQIAQSIRAGMSEGEACARAREVLQQMGMERVWHQVIVRFGENTLKIFNQKINPETILGENDIFFIDLGVVWEGIEGDAGATFTVGADEAMQRCASAAQEIWKETARFWLETQASGVDLYQYAAQLANQRGWVFNEAVKGHRVSEFPHKTYQAGDLGDLRTTPADGIWVLEIQLRHPERAFGAFYEDILWA